MSLKKKNLDLYLAEVFKSFIAIKDDDYKKIQEIFKGVFDQMKQKMEEQCNYFKKYSSQVLYAGSVYDNIKVSKLDEFDMDIVIRLPIINEKKKKKNYDEIVIKDFQPGFVNLKVDAFDLLDKQQNWELCHKATRNWRDGDKYLLQSKFRQWMHGIVQKALNDLNGRVTVNEVTYVMEYKESGPAYTLNVRNVEGNEEFKLHVDLVPVIRFQHPRWPPGQYRQVEESIVKDWLVVPKPNKLLRDGVEKNRCWRLSFQDHERDMMKGCQQLKPTIRLLKKLRDSLKMKAIASYYIKTLFLWKIDETKEKKYWQKGISVLFRTMVEELYNAIQNKSIPYFWNKENNLIANVKPTVLQLYANDLNKVLESIDSDNVENVLTYLLTTNELQEFKNSDFYCEKQAITPQTLPYVSIVSLPNTLESPKTAPVDKVVDLVTAMNRKIDALHVEIAKFTPTASNNKEEHGEDAIRMLQSLNSKMDAINNKLNIQNERLEKLEREMATRRNKSSGAVEELIDKFDAQNEILKNLTMTKNYNNDL